MSSLKVRLPVVIDFAKNAYVEVEVTKGSQNAYIMEFYLLNQGKAIAMEDIGVITLKATTESGAIVFNDVPKPEDGNVEYEISTTILAEMGRSTCVLQLMDAEGVTAHSFEFYVSVKASLYDENTYVQKDDITAIRSYMLRAENAADKSEEHEKYLSATHGSFMALTEEMTDVREDMEDYLDKVKEMVDNGDFVGASGIQGAQGEQGDKGEPFTYEDFTEEQLKALKGDQGEKGDTGESGIMTPISNHYVLSVEGGNLYVTYDGDKAPNFELDEEGNLYYVVSKEHKVAIGHVEGEKGEKGDKGDKGVSGVYVGSGDMPEGYNIQIDPSGETEAYATLSYVEDFVNNLVGNQNHVFVATYEVTPFADILAAFQAGKLCYLKGQGNAMWVLTHCYEKLAMFTRILHGSTTYEAKMRLGALQGIEVYPDNTWKIVSLFIKPTIQSLIDNSLSSYATEDFVNKTISQVPKTVVKNIIPSSAGTIKCKSNTMYTIYCTGSEEASVTGYGTSNVDSDGNQLVCNAKMLQIWCGQEEDSYTDRDGSVTASKSSTARWFAVGTNPSSVLSGASIRRGCCYNSSDSSQHAEISYPADCSIMITTGE